MQHVWHSDIVAANSLVGVLNNLYPSAVLEDPFYIIPLFGFVPDRQSSLQYALDIAGHHAVQSNA